MKKRIFFDLIVIVLLGLLPLLWLANGSILLGHDAGFALDPIVHFLDRIYVWSQRFSIGTDQNGALLGAFFIHGFEAFLAYLGFNLHWGQIIQFVFWFTSPGLAMYFFAYKIFPHRRYLPVFASIIYMLNFYLLQGWFIAERTKFSIYVAFPLALFFLVRYLTGKMSFVTTVISTGIVLGIFNGGGSLPLYGGLVFGILIVFFYINVVNFDLKTLRRTIFYTLGAGFFYVLLNAYWLIPYFFYISGFFSRDLAQAGGTEGALTWAKYLSSQSTFVNLFRGQGIPDWYLNPYHSYSAIFLHTPIFVIASLLFPILAFTSAWVVKSKRDSFYIYLLIFICLVGVLFSSGPESQFGFIYEAMVRFIPGFAMFRSAFFKFNYMVWFSYGLLIGFTADHLLSKVEIKYFRNRSFIFSTLAIITISAAYVWYHYPVLDGSFLNYSREPGKELTTRVHVPDYVFEFGKWVNAQDPNTRFLVMPQLGNTSYLSYQWHYWSIAPLTSLLARNSFLHNTALVPESERTLISEMYAAFLRADMDSFFDFAKVFAVDAIVVQNDYDWKNPSWGTVNPEKYEAVLRSHPELFIHEKTFGKWDIYRLTQSKLSLRINSSPKITFLAGKLGKVVSFPYFDPKSPLFMSDYEQKNQDYYAENATEIYLAPECIQCDLEYKEGTFKYYNPKLLPGSFLYPVVTFLEQGVKSRSRDFSSLLNFYITTSNRRIIESKWLVDSRKRIEEILPTLERYKATLHEIKVLLERPEWDLSAKVENRAAQMAISHILQQVNLLDQIYKDDIMSPYHRLSLAQSYNEILEIEKLAKSKAWVTEDMTNKKYIYDLPVTGDYEVYLKKGSLTYPDGDVSDTEISFKGGAKVMKSTASIGDWLSFGNVNLPNKKTFISLRDGTMSNLLDKLTPSFPDGTQGIIQDENNFTFTVDGLNKCLYYQFHDLEFANTQYAVSFKYRNFSDKNKLSFFNQVAEDEFLRYSIKDFELPNFRYWSTFTKLITPRNGNIRLNFCNGFLSLSEISSLKQQGEQELLPPGLELVEVRDVTFHKVAYPNIVLYKKQKSVADINTVLSFVKTNPVTYSINLEKTDQPISLMMRESFGKYWRVCDQKNKCLSFDDKSHFSSGGFANAWYLKDEPLSGRLTLYYYPQRWYVFGTVITLSSASLIIIFLCIRLLKRR